MTWKEYCDGVSLLTRHFGAFTKNEIDAGFKYWRNQTHAEFLQEIDLAFQIGKKPQLSKHYQESNKMPYYSSFEPETRIINDDCLDNILKENDAKSLLDLIFKHKKERA